MSDFETACEDMIRMSALMLSLDPERARPHCERCQADLDAGMDDMAEHAQRKHNAGKAKE